MTDLDRFVALLTAQVASETPPPPRDAAEHALAIASAAFAAWRAASTAPPRAVPIREHVALRQRLRLAESERDDLRRRLAEPQGGQLKPRGRHVAGHTTE